MHGVTFFIVIKTRIPTERIPSTTLRSTSTQQTFVSISNTCHVYKSDSEVDGNSEGLPELDLKTTRLTRFLKGEMLESLLDNTCGLLEIAFPDESLSISVSDAVRLLLENDVLVKNDKLKLVWTADITALESPGATNGKHPEDCLKNFLNDIGTVLLGPCPGRNPRRWSSVARAVALLGGPAERKPDLVLSSEPEGKGICWENIHSTLQLKYKDTSRLRNGNSEQLSSDAFMAFSSQNTMRFFLGTSICGYTVRVYVFNRSGRVSSVPFSIHDDPESLVRLLIGLMMCPTNLLGLDASFSWNGKYFLVKIKGVDYRLLECVFRSKTIRGRGTTCWRAVRDDNPNGPEYAIKDTWTDTSRTTEEELMEILEGVEGIPILVAAEKLNHEDGRDVTSYFHQNVEQKRTTSKGKTKGEHKKQKRTIEVRQHWLLVMTPFAQPLPSFSSKKELLSALVDALKAHEGMLMRHVLHRDISLDNIMIYSPATKPKKTNCDSDTAGEPEDAPSSAMKKGLLIDVDYSVVLPKEGSQDRKTAIGHRTGTLPFMAIEILEGETSSHGSHHDLESVFYVFIWICIFYRGPPRFRPLDTKTANWTGIEDIKMETVALAKKGIFKAADDFDSYLKVNTATYFSNLIPCLQELRAIFFNKASPATHKKMIEVLERHRNTLPEVDDWVDDEKPAPAKKRGRYASPERPPVKRLRTHESSQGTRSLPRRMTTLKLTQSISSQRRTVEGSDEDDNDEEDDEDEDDSSSEESDDEGKDPTYRRK
ncbi:hypothetical protein D9619_005082 [Psilocybe cf. subviscida]|uniref:Fungal-type protein kinase domain-containing protein n=1 Tax=Psilocybe cf. subviscida TaxID=2480587 RepID=A0A8H5BPZ1_9AGAR|nr:hypothetical protein D9619_005082 [Psilocybe cf. subviscida]